MLKALRERSGKTVEFRKRSHKFRSRAFHVFYCGVESSPDEAIEVVLYAESLLHDTPGGGGDGGMGVSVQSSSLLCHYIGEEDK